MPLAFTTHSKRARLPKRRNFSGRKPTRLIKFEQMRLPWEQALQIAPPKKFPPAENRNKHGSEEICGVTYQRLRDAVAEVVARVERGGGAVGGTTEGVAILIMAMMVGSAAVVGGQEAIERGVELEIGVPAETRPSDVEQLGSARHATAGVLSNYDKSKGPFFHMRERERWLFEAFAER